MTDTLLSMDDVLPAAPAAAELWWWVAAVALPTGIQTVSFSMNFEGPRVSPDVWKATSSMVKHRFGYPAMLISMTPATDQIIIK